MSLQATVVLITAFLLNAAVAQSQTALSVKASVDKNQVLIGEPVRLTLQAEIPESEPIRFFTIDSIPHFEFLEKGKIDTTNTDEGTLLKQVFRITSFDSGHWVIPSFMLTDKLATDTIPVDILFSPFDPGKDYHDVKDIIEVNPETKKQWWWYAAGGAFLLLLLLLYLLRRKKPVTVALTPPVDPYKEAMQKLELLQKQKPDSKLYYSSLTDIFRLYVFRKKGILSLQKTTDDLVVQLKNIGLAKNEFERLSQSLRLGDFVKFAKYIPSAEDDTTVFNSIREAIQQIEQLT